jgi:hypothetical protein
MSCRSSSAVSSSSGASPNDEAFEARAVELGRYGRYIALDNLLHRCLQGLIVQWRRSIRKGRFVLPLDFRHPLDRELRDVIGFAFFRISEALVGAGLSRATGEGQGHAEYLLDLEPLGFLAGLDDLAA